MAKLKVCGITNEADASLASELGCDFIGIIFTEESKRFVRQNIAKLIQRQVAPTTKLVGVFKNEDSNIVNKISYDLGLDLVQLHGSESNSYIHSIERPVIKALEYAPGCTDTNDFLNKSQQFKYCSHLLVDKPKGFFSNRTTQSKDSLDSHLPIVIPKLQTICKKVIVAGGITAISAKELQSNTNPYGFDVCSSIESSPGVKDHILLKELVAAIKQ